MAVKGTRNGCKFVGSEGCDITKCPTTKKCNVYNRERYTAERDTRLARQIAYDKQHKDEKASYDQMYYHSDIDYQRSRNAEYHATHRNEHCESCKRYHAATYIPTGDFKALMHKDGSVTRMRSMSEVYFFAMLEDEGVAYEYEVSLTTPMGVYIADGYIPELNIYVEVKGEYYVRELQNAKIEYLREHGYSIIMIDSELIDDTFGF